MFRIRQVHDILVLDADGELSRDNMHVFESLLENLAGNAQHNIILNCKELTHLDYLLVRNLADRIVQFQCDGGDLKMAEVSKYVQHIMDAMGLESHLYTSVEEALLSFLQEETIEHVYH